MTIDSKHPTEVLVQDISRFAEDIESLHTTLPLIMHVTGYLRKDTEKKYQDFMQEHAEVKEKTEDSTTYTLQMDDVSQANRFERQHQHFRHAYRLIPRHFVTSLVSQYDSFLGRVIRFMLAVRPELLNSSERALAYTELIAFTDIGAATAFVVEKEIESVIRKSHTDQFAWLKEKHKTPFNKDLPCWPQFIELTERRNLFVHTDGRVSSQYLSVCAEHKCSIAPNLSVGDQLEVPNDYFLEAYRCIYEIGVKLAHVIWRRLCQDHIDQSDNNIIDITFELIQKKEYDIAIRVLDFFTGKQIKHANDSNRRTMVVNRAQAYRWKGDADKAKAILDAEDWSSCEDKFKLAIAALRDNFDSCYSLMHRLQHDKDFHKAFYKDWPIFRELRKQEQFKAIYEECYGEPLAVEQTAEADQDAEQEDGQVSSEGAPSLPSEELSS